MAAGLEGGVRQGGVAMAAQVIHVVRHAHAGDPSRWQLDDDVRPLSERGIAQAEALADDSDFRRVTLVVSSPSLRCVATILPLARRLRRPLSTLDELYEGRTADAMLQRLAAEDAAAVVACTHGDVMTDLVALLERSGFGVGEGRAEKASRWTVELTDGRVTSASYAPPP